MLESGHEAKVRDYIVELGGMIVKVSGVRGFPDRVVITHTGRLYFLEMKQPAGRVKKYQKYIHKCLRGLKQDVQVAYTYEEAIEQYDRICSA